MKLFLLLFASITYRSLSRCDSLFRIRITLQQQQEADRVVARPHVLQAFQVPFSHFVWDMLFHFRFLVVVTFRIVFSFLFRKPAESFRPSVRACVRACLFFFSFLFLSLNAFFRFVILGLCRRKRKAHSRVEYIYLLLLLFPVLEEVRVIMFGDIDIWSRVLDLRYFFLTTVFFLLPERMVLSDQDVRG